MSGSHEPSLGRRAAVRLLIWGATGLSVLPGCIRRKNGPDPTVTCYKPVAMPDPTQAPLLERWARLGDIWREIGRHDRSPDGGPGGRERFEALRSEMTAALDAVDASPELRLAFDRRWGHVSASIYPQVTCYEIALPCPGLDALGSMQMRVRELETLAEEGKVTPEVAHKAAEALALDIEVMRRDEEINADDDWEGDHEALKRLDEEYKADAIKPREGAARAGERLAELTVDDLGLLAGMPEEKDFEAGEGDG